MGAAYVQHAEDDDWGQAGTLVHEVLDDAARDRLVSNIVGILLNGVTEPVLQRAFWYLGNEDKNLGERVEKGVRDGLAFSGQSSGRPGCRAPCSHEVYGWGQSR